MKKKYSLPLFPIALTIVLVVVLVFGHLQANKQEKRINEIQTVVFQNNQAATQIVDFINASLAQVQE